MVSSSLGFQTAHQIAEDLPASLSLPPIAQDLVGGVITGFESGCINMIESDQLKEAHRVLHSIMVEAVSQDWNVILVDLANCFNPQFISTIAFEQGISGHSILKNIHLSRPFQIFQAVDIIKNLRAEVRRRPGKQLILLTDLSSMFFDAALANEDPLFPIPQLEMMRQCVGILQSLVVQGHTVIITDTTKRVKSLAMTADLPHVKPASLRYSAKLHLKIEHTTQGREINLIAHPYLAATSKIEQDLQAMIEARKPKRQLSLNDFF